MVDRLDVEGGADLAACPDCPSPSLWGTRTGKPVRRHDDVGQKDSELPAIALRDRGVEIGPVGPFAKTFLDDAGWPPDELVIAAADGERLETALNAQDRSDVGGFPGYGEDLDRTSGCRDKNLERVYRIKNSVSGSRNACTISCD